MRVWECESLGVCGCVSAGEEKGSGLPSVVLMYHRIGSPLVRSIVRGQYVTAGLLRRQVAWLAKQGYTAVPLAEMLATQTCTGHVSLTFDDGYSNFLTLGYPVLAEKGVRATIYAVAGLIGKTNVWDSNIGDRSEPLMTADELRDLSAAGCEISCHGMTHAHLTELSDADLRVEVADSKKLIEDLIGAPAPGFGYPYGQWDARIRDAVIEAGYMYAASTRKGVIVPGQDMYDVPRINVRWANVPTILAGKIREGMVNGSEGQSGHQP